MCHGLLFSLSNTWMTRIIRDNQDQWFGQISPFSNCVEAKAKVKVFSHWHVRLILMGRRAAFCQHHHHHHRHLHRRYPPLSLPLHPRHHRFRYFCFIVVSQQNIQNKTDRGSAPMRQVIMRIIILLQHLKAMKTSILWWCCWWGQRGGAHFRMWGKALWSPGVK